jgi:hypothetical protein
MRWPPPRMGMATKLPGRRRAGAAQHERRLVADAGRVDPAVFEADAEGSAYVGFTASTGSGFENHDILAWSLTPEASSSLAVVQSSIQFRNITCLEGRNLCTPKEASLEERAPGQYHVILPAHLEWGASIPNPSARPVTPGNVRGSVCWDLKERGAEGCGGPESAAATARGQEEFLAPDRKAGAPIMKNAGGRTWFSVNGRSRGLADNQGYFEFDAGIQ